MAGAGNHAELSVLAVTQGQWGERIADHVGRHPPPSWTIHRWTAPRVLPLVVDDPADYLPRALPAVDIILALGDTPAVAQLIPDVVRLTGAKSVIAPMPMKIRMGKSSVRMPPS